MTKTEFVSKFLVKFDRVATLGAPGFSLPELSLIVTDAQESLITKKYGPNSNRLKEGFEETEKRIQEIGELVKYKNITIFTPGFLTNGINAQLPNTLIDLVNADTTSAAGPTNFDDVYWYTIYEEAITDQLDCTIVDNTTVFVKSNVIEVSHDQFNLAYENPFRKPYLNGNKSRIFRLRGTNRMHQLITDGTFNITTYKLGYIKKPIPIDLALNITDPVCQLSDSFHRELLDETVDLAKLEIQDPSFQIMQAQIKE